MTDSNVLPATSAPNRQTVLEAVRLAGRAPSIHNTQPWRWIYDGTQLRLYRDNDRLLAATDRLGRQQVISCGAVLHHLRTVLAARGWHTDTTRLPDPGDMSYLARIDFRPWPDPPAGVLTRADAIAERRTDRLPLLPPDNWSALVHRARMLANPHDIELDVLDDSAHPRLATASAHAAALRRYDMEYQSELRWWAGHSNGSEGVPRTALASDAESARVDIARDFPAAPHSARRGELTDQAALIVLSSPSDSVRAWLHTGEALSAVLLECTAAGLATCALTHITELPTGRKTVAAMLARPAVPQVVIRVGTAPADEVQPPRSPRRSPTEVLTFQDS